MLEVQQLTKLYRGLPGVRDVSFTLHPGEVLGYIGPNGSGKSTTIKMLTGLVEPTGGRILFNGQAAGNDMVSYKSRIGFVPEEPYLYSHLSGMEYLSLVGRLRGLSARSTRSRSEELLQLFSLGESRWSRMAGYSKGMRQRVLISAALIANPELIILDEPFSGLDVNAAMLFRELLKCLAESGRMILFSSHVLEVVEKLCSRVVILHHGSVVAQESVGRLRELSSAPSLTEVFSQLTGQEDYAGQARRIVNVIANV